MIVYVSKNFELSGIYQDEVIQIDTDKYKSIKFRHTYYTSADFNFSLKDTEKFVRQKYNLTMWSFSL
jgi:hypothetical protein